MKLSSLSRSYQAIFSLGGQCLTASQLLRKGLRPYTGMLDWNRSRPLSTVNLLLQQRFKDYMDRKHLEFVGYDQGERCLMLRDTQYDIYSVHDYPTAWNTPDNLVSYEIVKEMYDRRVNRFIQLVREKESVLFVRIGGSYDEAVELSGILARDYVKEHFAILLVQPSDEYGIKECDWGLEHVCVVEMPTNQLHDELWDKLLAGVIYEK